jgi:hypothetical protein
VDTYFVVDGSNDGDKQAVLHGLVMPVDGHLDGRGLAVVMRGLWIC